MESKSSFWSGSRNAVATITKSAPPPEGFPMPSPPTKMEDAGAKFVTMILDRLQALEGEVQLQSDKIDELQKQARVPVLASGSISSEQMAFNDGTAIHWALGRPAGMYVDNELVPLAPPYSDMVIARGPLMMLVCGVMGLGFNVSVSHETGRITLGQLIAKVNEHLTTTVGHWSDLEPYLGRSAWQLRQTPCGWMLEVDMDFPVLTDDPADQLA